MPLEFAPYLAKCQQRIQRLLEHELASLSGAATLRLQQAMQYACLQGGKRIRPVLVYASAAAVGGNEDCADVPACAVELIHCYSLVHDDLPAMDDDDLRRGQPTVHRAFDEATAILAGDALQAMAFSLLSTGSALQTSAETRLRMLGILSNAAGSAGMVAGQAMDFEAMGRRIELVELETLHSLKTGALITASVELGALTAEHATVSQRQALRKYAQYTGLAFQVQDDIIDVTSDTATLGKTQGADQALDKPTYVSLLGLSGAQQKVQELSALALGELACFDHAADPLRALTRYIVTRNS